MPINTSELKAGNVQVYLNNVNTAKELADYFLDNPHSFRTYVLDHSTHATQNLAALFAHQDFGPQVLAYILGQHVSTKHWCPDHHWRHILGHFEYKKLADRNPQQLINLMIVFSTLPI